MVKNARKIIYLIAAWSFIILGVIGIFLPLLPTTPFILLAAYLFSKSSRRLHQWLLDHKVLGPLINSWEKHGVISLPAKKFSTLMIVPLFAYTLIYVKVIIAIKIVVLLTAVGVLSFIWSMPSYPRD